MCLSKDSLNNAESYWKTSILFVLRLHFGSGEGPERQSQITFEALLERFQEVFQIALSCRSDNLLFGFVELRDFQVLDGPFAEPRIVANRDFMELSSVEDAFRTMATENGCRTVWTTTRQAGEAWLRECLHRLLDQGQLPGVSETFGIPLFLAERCDAEAAETSQEVWQPLTYRSSERGAEALARALLRLTQGLRNATDYAEAYGAECDLVAMNLVRAAHFLSAHQSLTGVIYQQSILLPLYIVTGRFADTAVGQEAAACLEQAKELVDSTPQKRFSTIAF